MLHVQSVLQYRPIFAASPRPRKALFTPILQLPRSLAGRRLFGFRFGNFCCVINSSRTEGETPKEGRRTPPQKSDNLQAARGGGGGWCGLPELPFFRRPFPGTDAEIFPHGDILLECSSFEAADARRARALPVPQLPLSAPPPLPPFRPRAGRPRPIAGHPPVRPSRFRRQTISRFRRLLFLAVRSSVNHVRARATSSL